MSEDRWLNQFCKWVDAEWPTHNGPCIPTMPAMEYCILLLEDQAGVLDMENAAHVELEQCP